jgi:tRNA-dihydrouridine synthase
MSKVDAHWEPEIFSQVLALRDQRSPTTLILGNGDVKTIEEAKQKAESFGIDGVMLGSSVFSPSL